MAPVASEACPPGECGSGGGLASSELVWAGEALELGPISKVKGALEAAGVLELLGSTALLVGARPRNPNTV